MRRATLIQNIGKSKELLNRRKGAKLFSQGEKADAIYFIQTGKFKLTVVSGQGKKALLAIIRPPQFLGEECLVEDARRTSTATSLESSTVFRVKKQDMLQAIRIQPALSAQFMASLLIRNVSMEEDLCDQLFNHSERRLACALLKLARGGHPTSLKSVKIPTVTSKKLAGIVGTTPEMVDSFMHKFRKLGLIEFEGDGDVKVMSGLLTDLLLRG